MRDWNILAIHRIQVRRLAADAWRKMTHQLVSAQIEIDPGLAAATAWATQQLAVEFAGGSQVVDLDGEMKWGERHGLSCENFLYQVEVAAYEEVGDYPIRDSAIALDVKSYPANAETEGSIHAVAADDFLAFVTQ